MKKYYFITFLVINFYALAQVGINNSSPKSTLEITAARPTGTLNPEIKDGIIIPNLDRARAQAIGNNNTPITANSTLIYVNDITTGTAAQSAINIQSTGFYYYDTTVLPAPGAWQAVKPIVNLEFYGGQAAIPPHRTQGVPDFVNNTNKAYDNPSWKVISKTSTTKATNLPPKMVVVYEYQGTPFNLTNLYPTLTAGNTTQDPDVYVANVISIANNGTGGNTRLTAAIVRVDNIAVDWAGTFVLNILLTRRVN